MRSGLRNVRSCGERAIPTEDLDRVLEAARPHTFRGNQQAWDFVVCTDREQLEQLARVFRAARHVAGSAATIALVAPKPDDARMRDLIQFDLGQVTMSIMLATPASTTSSSRVACWAFPRTVSVLIALGFPADRPLTPLVRPSRRPFDEVVQRGHW